MPLQAVTNSISGRFSRGAPVFIISSCEGDGSAPSAVRDLVGRGHEVTVLSPASVDYERLVSRVPRMAYEVLKLERQNRLTTLAGFGAQIIDWLPDVDLSQALLQVRGSEMVGEVAPQGEGIRSLHVRTMRTTWQVLTLQSISTVAMIGAYLIIVSTYVVGSIDHTQIFTSLDQSLDGLLPLGSWLTGVGRNGLGRFVVPMLIGIVFGASMAGMAFLPDRIQYWVKMGSILALMVVVFGRFLTAWIWEMITQLEVSAPGSQSEYLVGPILMLLQIGVMAFYFLPVILGTRGIWGLSRRGVVWSIGYMLLFLGIHALLTFQVIRIRSTQGDNSGCSISKSKTPRSDCSVSNSSPHTQFSLILIAGLLLVFQECAFGVIRYLDYCHRLPESCKKDPEYVQQVTNVLNGHLRHTGIYLSLTILATMIALGFHAVVLDGVGGVTGSQWAGQVSDSIELRLTYGLVISALLFLGFVATIKFLIPWERVSLLMRAFVLTNHETVPSPSECASTHHLTGDQEHQRSLVNDNRIIHASPPGRTLMSRDGSRTPKMVAKPVMIRSDAIRSEQDPPFGRATSCSSSQIDVRE